MNGCSNLLVAIRAAAIERLGFPNEEITIADGVVSGGAKRAELSEFVEADGAFATTIRTYSYGARACHAAVDRRTGGVEVLDYVAIEDVGRAINPHIVHGRVIGTPVQGLGRCVSRASRVRSGCADALRRSLMRRWPTTWCPRIRFPERARDHDGAAPVENQPSRRQRGGRGRAAREWMNKRVKTVRVEIVEPGGQVR